MCKLTLDVLTIVLLTLVVIFALLVAILFISHTIYLVLCWIRSMKPARDSHGRFMKRS